MGLFRKIFGKEHLDENSRNAKISPSMARKLTDDIPEGAKWAFNNLNASGYKVDGSIDSLKEIDRFVDEQHGPGGALDGKMGHIIFALGSYIGETIIKNYGGEWITDDSSPEGEISIAVKLKNGNMVWPVMRMIKRIKEGSENAIYPYALAAGEEKE